MNTIKITASKQYEVRIERGILAQAGRMIGEIVAPCKACIVTDDNVEREYADRVQTSLAAQGFDTHRFSFPHGEVNKTLATVADIMEFLNNRRFSRSDLIVALGGGIVGDVAGFAAAVYLRGVRFVQIPTTLLAAVDSSVGGTTAVNLGAGKNLAGAFWQPELVLCDIETFESLPHDYYTDGLAEMIKCAMICDPALFAEFASGEFDLERAIVRCVQIKAAVVEKDERDTGVRQLVNFGHTIGHGIEKSSDYSISHGHAVAVGMVAITRAAVRLGLVGEDCLDALVACLARNDLPVSCDYPVGHIIDAALSDKKRKGDEITLVLPTALGRCELRRIKTSMLGELIKIGLQAEQAPVVGAAARG